MEESGNMLVFLRPRPWNVAAPQSPKDWGIFIFLAAFFPPRLHRVEFCPDRLGPQETR